MSDILKESNMRKHIITLLCLLAGWMPLCGQTMYIHQGAVTTAVPATAAGDITYDHAAGTLSLMGQTYHISETDALSFSAENPAAYSVEVNWTETGARVLMSADLHDLLSVTVDGSRVSLIAAPELQQEVTYTLSGTSADGSFYMDGEYKATFVLQNLTLSSTQGAPLTIDCGKRIAMQLPDGTTTTLADAAGGTHKACLFINGHAEWQGGGTLNLTGRTKHAYASDEYTELKAGFGTINVLGSVTDGLHIEQFFRMEGGTVNVNNCGGDNIDVSITNDPADERNGQAHIVAGTLNLSVTAADTKGLKCDSLITIDGGTLTATVSGDGGKGISAGTDLVISQVTDAQPTLIRMTVPATTYMPGDPVLEAKARGIKVKRDFTFNGGTIDITATGAKAKAISVDGTYTRNGGSINCVVDATDTVINN